MRKFVWATLGLLLAAGTAVAQPRWPGPLEGIADYNGSQFGVYNPFPAAPAAVVSGGDLVASAIVPNNTTAVVVKASPGQIYAIDATNNSATIAYLKIYNATSATAGSGTPYARIMIPAAATGGTVLTRFPVGDVYSTGITYIVTTGIADTDTAAPAASTYIVNIHYK